MFHIILYFAVHCTDAKYSLNQGCINNQSNLFNTICLDYGDTSNLQYSSNQLKKKNRSMMCQRQIQDIFNTLHLFLKDTYTRFQLDGSHEPERHQAMIEKELKSHISTEDT